MGTRGFRVVAIIAVRNEEDIIGQVLDDLIAQHIEVIVIDDGSVDGTLHLARKRLGRGVVAIERREPSAVFDWTGLLLRKEQIAAQTDADWFIHHDADEFRESPWPELNLRAAIECVDASGHNAIDFRVLNFRPTIDVAPGTDIRLAMPHYEPGDHWDRLQIKAWKRQSGPVDLASSGGHDARFDGRMVFPVPFLLRHYPLRSRAQARKKIFEERLPRFAVEERARGWHVQYDSLADREDFLWSESELVLYDALAVKRALCTPVAHDGEPPPAL
jgi:glycosyltransferase involved in cell wall biosynthesis